MSKQSRESLLSDKTISGKIDKMGQKKFSLKMIGQIEYFLEQKWSSSVTSIFISL